jgi:rod shape-determining protein MreD
MHWILLAVAVLFQLTLADMLMIGQAAPNWLFISLFLVAASFPTPKAALVGFLAGLLLDLGGVDPLGAFALTGCTAAFFAARHLSRDRKLPLLRMLPRALLILLPLEIFLANLRFTTMDSHWYVITTFRALPSAFYSLVVIALLWALPMRQRH